MSKSKPSNKQELKPRDDNSQSADSAALEIPTGARRAILEDLFQDLHKDRRHIYVFNLFRGMMFGFGSVIGATLLIAVAVYVLGVFTDIPGGIGDFVQRIIDAMSRSS